MNNDNQQTDDLKAGPSIPRDYANRTEKLDTTPPLAPLAVHIRRIIGLVVITTLWPLTLVSAAWDGVTAGAKAAALHARCTFRAEHKDWADAVRAVRLAVRYRTPLGADPRDWENK